MTLRLTVDAAAWDAHLRLVAEDTPGLVPVTKGNGYGFGLVVTAHQADRLGCDTLAVGTEAEAEVVAAEFAGDLLVLQPWRPELEPTPVPDARRIRTAATVEAAAALQAAGVRHVVEVLTSMRRFGIAPDRLPLLPTLLAGDGVALHLPLDAPSAARTAEVEHILGQLRGHGFAPAVVWVSHLAPAEAALLSERHPGIAWRHRVGTRLWLGDRGALRVSSTVLETHPLRRGDRFGYRFRQSRGDAVLVIATGGTAHGIGLAAPATPSGVAARGKAAGRGALEAVGRSLSPFRHEGRRLWFAEPPHMQVSLLLANAGEAPRVGDSLDVDVRLTTTTVDEVVGVG